jgi:hypothetical protein
MSLKTFYEFIKFKDFKLVRAARFAVDVHLKKIFWSN